MKMLSENAKAKSWKDKLQEDHVTKRPSHENAK